jgi:hypothetical protein
MRNAVFIIVFAWCCALACSREKKVTPAGPAVPDQLRSRGYITTPHDTMHVRDSTQFKLDTLQ